MMRRSWPHLSHFNSHCTPRRISTTASPDTIRPRHRFNVRKVLFGCAQIYICVPVSALSGWVMPLFLRNHPQRWWTQNLSWGCRRTCSYYDAPSACSVACKASSSTPYGSCSSYQHEGIQPKNCVKEQGKNLSDCSWCQRVN